MKFLWLPHERGPCFLGFLCSGELTVPSQFRYDPATHLSIQDVAVEYHEHPTMVQLSLKSSKTDPFWRGVQIVIRSTQDELCPVAALLAYLAVRGGSPGPLFRFMNGLPLTHPEFVSRVKGALQALGQASGQEQP